MHMAKNSARSWLVSARPSSSEENRAPTPVSEMTPTMMPGAGADGDDLDRHDPGQFEGARWRAAPSATVSAS
jgi:hypothetical protein